LLLHLVDIAPIDLDADPAIAFRAIEGELKKFSAELSGKTRWLVINKVDLLAEDDLEVAREMLLGEIDWDGPVFLVSAETGEGTDELGQAIMRELEEMDQVESGSVDP